MSPENGMIQEVRFELNGQSVVAYRAFSRRRSDAPAGDSPEPVRWRIQIGEGKPFPGPVFRGYPLGEQRRAETELRQFLERDRGTDS